MSALPIHQYNLNPICGAPQPDLPHVILISSTQGKYLEPKQCSMFLSCLLLTFQENFHLYQGSIALLPASVWKYHFNDLDSHCDKGRFFVKLRSWFSVLRLNSQKDRKDPAVCPAWGTGMQCSCASGSTRAAGERAAVPNVCQEHHLPSFRLLANPLRSLSIYLCNWSGICKKHRPTHAHGALMQDVAWTVRWGNTAGSRQSYRTIYFKAQHISWAAAQAPLYMRAKHKP